MAADTIYLTAQTLWPLLVAVIVWIVTMRRSADTDEISNVVDALTRHDNGNAESPNHLSRSGRRRAATHGAFQAKKSSLRTEANTRLHTRIRRRHRHHTRRDAVPAVARALITDAMRTV